jgi:lysyl-tRNA synthetase class 2
LADYALDERFLAALDAGIPKCAGVALGFDRALMVCGRLPSIKDVLSFTTERA